MKGRRGGGGGEVIIWVRSVYIYKNRGGGAAGKRGGGAAAGRGGHIRQRWRRGCSDDRRFSPTLLSPSS